MSHYNSSTANSWQSRSNNNNNNNNNSGSSNNGLYSNNTHDLVSGYGTGGGGMSGSTSLTGVNSPAGLVGLGGGGVSNYTNPTASLLAQFAVNSVNFGNLAATLPAALVNANVLAAANMNNNNNNNSSSVNNSTGYQWHTPASSVQQSSNSSHSSRSASDQRIVSIGSGGSSSNNSGSSGYNSKSSSSSKGGHDVRPLMEIETMRRNQQAQQQAKSMPKPVPAPSSSSNRNGHSGQRSSERDRIDRSDRVSDRDRRADSASSSGKGLTITTSNLNAAASSLAAANPLAQALLNQLAAQSGGGSNNTALVAALAAANAAVASQQKQMNKSSTQRRSRSPSSSSNHRTTTSSSSTAPPPRRNLSNSNSNRTPLPGSSSSSTYHRRTSRSRSPLSSASKRLSSSHLNNASSSHATANSSSAAATTTSTSSSTKQSSTALTTSSSSTSSRYSIKVPKYSLDLLTNNVSGVKTRYGQMYVPSDFIDVRNSWVNSLPINRPLKFNSRCLFHVMRKEAHPIEPNEAIYDPPDADHTWTVKVMLLSMPSMSELFKRTCSFGDESTLRTERLEHPSKVIQFLVGNKGKHELMALGGPWSAALDGPNPATNPQALINTAIRTVKALTGIDLGPCTQWFRFLDIQYNRNEDFKTIILPNSKLIEKSSAGDSAPAANGEKAAETAASATNGVNAQVDASLDLNDYKDVETTVIFLPNVWSLMPNSIEYQRIVEAYKNFIDNPPAPFPTTASATSTTAAPAASSSSSDPSSSSVDMKPVEVAQQPEQQPEQQTTSDKPSTQPANENQSEIKCEEMPQQQQQQQPSNVESSELVDAGDDAGGKGMDEAGTNEVSSIEALTKSLKAEFAAANKINGGQRNAGAASTNQSANDTSDLAEYDENDDSESKLEPTHYSKLDVKKMKVDELRTELMARDMDTRGLKGQLILRLKEALEQEKEREMSQEVASAEASAGGEDSQQSNNEQSKAPTSVGEDESSATNKSAEDSTAAANDTVNAKPDSNVDPMQLQQDNSDVLYTHVNDNDIESFQIDEKDVSKETSGVAEKKPAAAEPSAAEIKAAEQKAAAAALAASKLGRHEREKLYKLPPSPHIIVHPSRTAKNNKFDCQLVSLSHLLDYRKEDNKESSFEVSLFAEYFNEMLIRDYGFVIYKHLLATRTEKDKELMEHASRAVLNNLKRKLSGEVKEEDAKEEDPKRAKANDESAKKPETAEVKKEEKVDATAAKTATPAAAVTTPTITSTTIQLSKPKPKTVHPELLLAFTYFDTNRTNFVYEKDLEDLLLSIGLSLSRSKVKALIMKLTIKDKLVNYRLLTDKLPKEIEENSAKINFCIPTDDEIISSIITYDSYMQRVSSTRRESQSEAQQDLGIIELNGTTIDVMNTIKSLEKSEQTVQTLDYKLKDSIEEIDRLKTLNKTAERVKTRLTDELNEYKKKLRDQIRTNKEIDDKYSRFKECLTKSKSTLIKVLDDVSDVLKRGQPGSTTTAPVKTIVKTLSTSDVKKSDATTTAKKEVNVNQATTKPATAIVATKPGGVKELKSVEPVSVGAVASEDTTSTTNGTAASVDSAPSVEINEDAHANDCDDQLIHESETDKILEIQEQEDEDVQDDQFDAKMDTLTVE